MKFEHLVKWILNTEKMLEWEQWQARKAPKKRARPQDDWRTYDWLKA
jgi:hypothetical protein